MLFVATDLTFFIVITTINAKRMDTLRKNITWILILVAALLVIGCFSLPIGYYTFLRIAVCVASVLAIVANIEESFTFVNIVFAVVAIFFNPIIPIHLHSKEAWTVIDALCAAWMIYGVVHFKRSKIE